MTTGYVVEKSATSTGSFFGELMHVQIAGEETGVYSLTEHTFPAGFRSPTHSQYHEDQGIYVLQGSVQVWSGDRSYTVSAGDFTFLPKGVAHTWRVSDSRAARLLIITSPPSEAATAREIPQPQDGEGIGRVRPVTPLYETGFVSAS